MAENYSEFCINKRCENCIRWFNKSVDSTSCLLVYLPGNEIEDYPDECVHIEEIVHVVIE